MSAEFVLDTDWLNKKGACLVNARNAVRLRSCCPGTASDVDLGTFHLPYRQSIPKEIYAHATYVELSSVRLPGSMEGNHLSPQQVLSVGDTRRNVNDLVSLVVDDFVCSPVAVAVAVFLDLEPERT
jgi:hypothetical protein